MSLPPTRKRSAKLAVWRAITNPLVLIRAPRSGGRTIKTTPLNGQGRLHIIYFIIISAYFIGKASVLTCNLFHNSQASWKRKVVLWGPFPALKTTRKQHDFNMFFFRDPETLLKTCCGLLFFSTHSNTISTCLGYVELYESMNGVAQSKMFDQNSSKLTALNSNKANYNYTYRHMYSN